MKVKLPRRISRRVAERATQKAKIFTQRRGWKSSDDFEPLHENGMAGIRVFHKYHLYQNYGTKPRDMVELEGKTIPMPDENGGTRFVRVKGVGEPGYVTLPGGVKVWRERKWHHPGIKPLHFLDDALQEAITETLESSPPFFSFKYYLGSREIIR